jgi:hypothetical protein
LKNVQINVQRNFVEECTKVAKLGKKQKALSNMLALDKQIAINNLAYTLHKVLKLIL